MKLRLFSNMSGRAGIPQATIAALNTAPRLGQLPEVLRPVAVDRVEQLPETLVEPQPCRSMARLRPASRRTP